jgi:uncharacterized protein involved in exopolysaccharide biosynthesis
LTEQNVTQTGQLGGQPDESNRFIDPEDQVSLREMALVPWKHRAVVIGCTVFCALFAALICILMHPRYRSTATIELNEQQTSGASMLSNIASEASGDPDALKVKIETETAVIKDDSIALAVMSKMGMLRLENPDKFSKQEGPQVSEDALPSSPLPIQIGIQSEPRKLPMRSLPLISIICLNQTTTPQRKYRRGFKVS